MRAFNGPECGICAVPVLLAALVSICKSINTYPGVSLESNMAPELTQPSNLFIYSWPAEVQASCPGTVTALEYCYQRRGPSPSQQPTFTLVLLEVDSTRRGFNVTQIIDVVAPSLSVNCSNREGINTCCVHKPLEQQRQFDIPSTSTMFGIFAMGDDRILGYRQGQENSTVGFQIFTQVDAIWNGFIPIPLNSAVSLEYRMFNFIIGEANNDLLATEIPPSATASTIQPDNISEDSAVVPAAVGVDITVLVAAVVTVVCTVLAVLIGLVVVAVLCVQRYRDRHGPKQPVTDQQLQSTADLKESFSITKNITYDYAVPRPVTTVTSGTVQDVLTYNKAYGCREDVIL